MSKGQGDIRIIKHDFNMLANIKTTYSRVSLQIVSEDSPVTFPNNADVILAWCFSIMYDHKTECTCFYMGKVINEMIVKENIDLAHVFQLVQ